MLSHLSMICFVSVWMASVATEVPLTEFMIGCNTTASGSSGSIRCVLSPECLSDAGKLNSAVNKSAFGCVGHMLFNADPQVWSLIPESSPSSIVCTSVGSSCPGICQVRCRSNRCDDLVDALNEFVEDQAEEDESIYSAPEATADVRKLKTCGVRAISFNDCLSGCCATKDSKFNTTARKCMKGPMVTGLPDAACTSTCHEVHDCDRVSCSAGGVCVSDGGPGDLQPEPHCVRPTELSSTSSTSTTTTEAVTVLFTPDNCGGDEHDEGTNCVVSGDAGAVCGIQDGEYGCVCSVGYVCTGSDGRVLEDCFGDEFIEDHCAPNRSSVTRCGYDAMNCTGNGDIHAECVWRDGVYGCSCSSSTFACVDHDNVILGSCFSGDTHRACASGGLAFVPGEHPQSCGGSRVNCTTYGDANADCVDGWCTCSASYLCYSSDQGKTNGERLCETDDLADGVCKPEELLAALLSSSTTVSSVMPTSTTTSTLWSSTRESTVPMFPSVQNGSASTDGLHGMALVIVIVLAIFVGILVMCVIIMRSRRATGASRPPPLQVHHNQEFKTMHQNYAYVQDHVYAQVYAEIETTDVGSTTSVTKPSRKTSKNHTQLQTAPPSNGFQLANQMKLDSIRYVVPDQSGSSQHTYDVAPRHMSITSATSIASMESTKPEDTEHTYEYQAAVDTLTSSKKSSWSSLHVPAEYCVPGNRDSMTSIESVESTASRFNGFYNATTEGKVDGDGFYNALKGNAAGDTPIEESSASAGASASASASGHADSGSQSLPEQEESIGNDYDKMEDPKAASGSTDGFYNALNSKGSAKPENIEPQPSGNDEYLHVTGDVDGTTADDDDDDDDEYMC